MIGTARNFMLAAMGFLTFGIVVGLYMAISTNHEMAPAHAHIQLAGWVSHAIFAFFYRSHRDIAESVWGKAHFLVSVVSTAVMTVSLVLLMTDHPGAEPGAAIGSLVFAASLLIFFRNCFVSFGRD